ncbi:2Fe-2S iron-sulfur cluster-binding protein [Paenibacillus sp. BR1-192]|uniref:2Fe-2S iron-sulfur cluster-binding protein n=1 Tax=Paenibacillus sp. BR1-192 TaxID=3032287 RepID=UPI00240DBDE0|nr:2Fe-2S iron-sulfur cluster-binding protein [Paenibacillus sp. BR1-192]WFB56287.1 2Fe-2S iron-sulfur cluster-binding protein [Paenibacillus sp. BR1-192]
MFKFWKNKKSGNSGEKSSLPAAEERMEAVPDRIIELTGREVQRSVAPVLGMTVLDLAERNEVDWNSFCKRGTCARCRCMVVEGIEYLSEPNLAEERRLDPEEIEEGYRLGCQSRIETVGPVKIKHAPYF